MPLRITRRLHVGERVDGVYFIVPNVLYDSIGIHYADKLQCLLKNHFDENQKLIQQPDEPCCLGIHKAYHLIQLQGLPITKKYGLLKGEGIELVVEAILRTKDRLGRTINPPEEIKVFPTRVVEDFEFDPSS